MSNVITKFEMFLEKNSNGQIRSYMKQAVKTAFGVLKSKVKEAKNIDEVNSITADIVKEIDNLKTYVKGAIVLAINESETNEAFDIAATLSDLKTTIKNLLHKKTSSLDLAKKEALAKINKVEKDLLNFVKEMNLDVEKTNAKMAKFKGDASYEPVFLV